MEFYWQYYSAPDFHTCRKDTPISNKKTSRGFGASSAQNLKKNSSRIRHSSPDKKTGSQTRRIAFGVVIGVFICASGFSLLKLFQVHQLHSGIPKTPDVSGFPSAFAMALEDATEKAVSFNMSHAAEGVENLGRLYHANGFYDDAASCWEALLKTEPSQAKWSYYLADGMRLQGNESEMGTLLERVVQLAPEYAPAWLKLGTHQFAAGKWDAAQASFLRRMELIPDDAYAAVGLARISIQKGDSEEARKWLQKAISGTPDLSTAHILLARVLAASGDIFGADHQNWLGTEAGRFREAPDPWIDDLANDCYDVNQLLTWGSIDYQTLFGDHGKSLFERAMRLEPENAESYEALGRIYLDAGDAKKAVEILTQGVEKPNVPATLYVRLSEAYRQLKRPIEALNAAKDGLSEKPGDPDLLVALGTVLDDIGQYDDAVEAFETVMADAERAAEANLRVALVMEHAGKKEQAYDYLRKALELRPKYPQALAELGVLELDAWNLESASKYIHAFYDNYPGSVRAKELMAQLSVREAILAVRNNDLNSAETVCLEGLQINPNSPDLNSFLGVLYAQQKRYLEAVRLLETAFQFKPTDLKIVTNLVQVYMDQQQLNDARRVLMVGERAMRESGNETAARQVRQALSQLPAGNPGR